MTTDLIRSLLEGVGDRKLICVRIVVGTDLLTSQNSAAAASGSGFNSLRTHPFMSLPSLTLHHNDGPSWCHDSSLLPRDSLQPLPAGPAWGPSVNGRFRQYLDQDQPAVIKGIWGGFRGLPLQRLCINIWMSQVVCTIIAGSIHSGVD